MPRRKLPPAIEIFRVHRLLVQALAAYDRETTGREPMIGDIHVPLDDAGHPLPNPVIIRTNIEQVCRWLWTLFPPPPSGHGQEVQFGRWWVRIQNGERLADILREAVPEEKRRLTMRKNFERWRRTVDGAFRGP
jgi:hypothetical protein